MLTTWAEIVNAAAGAMGLGWWQFLVEHVRQMAAIPQIPGDNQPLKMIMPPYVRAMTGSSRQGLDLRRV